MRDSFQVEAVSYFQGKAWGKKNWSELNELAFHGTWNVLLRVLREHPHLVNVGSDSKGYSPLHQAAWHGADLSVIGALLAIGADRGQKTKSKNQTAQEIALEKRGTTGSRICFISQDA